MDRISLSTVDLQRWGDRYAIDMAAQLDLDGIDLDLSMHDVANDKDVYSKGEAAVIEYFTSLSEYAREKGITVAQTHDRLYGYGVTPEGDVRFLENARYDTIATAILGAEYCVVHTPAYNWVGDLRDDEMYRIGVSLFSAILPFAKEKGVKIKNAISYDMESPTFNGKAFLSLFVRFRKDRVKGAEAPRKSK